MMTVRELIEELQKQDQDKDVVFYDSERKIDLSVDKVEARNSRPSGLFSVVGLETS